jgi:tetratricopeptide (TPR) repeat protein
MTDAVLLRTLFDRALAMDNADRQAFLDAHCASAAQRAQIERLLAADHDPSDPFADATAPELAQAIGEEPEPVWHPGERIGDWTLEASLGEGGSASVFSASRDLGGVRQQAALKLLRRGLYSADARRQFRRERQALAALVHPNIAHLIDGGITESGVPYLVMEHVDGTTITDHARTGQLDIATRLRLVVQVCRAVAVAHRNLFVHRDLKPANILVTASGDVKLLDFGIAKLLDADVDDPADTTRSGYAPLTPGYAAPEQYSGGAISTATDVYALGVLLHELLLGERPVRDRPTRPSVRVAELATDLWHLPATRSELRAALRGDLDNIVLKALAEEPGRRYAGAAELADDLERHLGARPVQAHPPSRWYRTRKFVQRHRGGVVVSTALALGLLTSLGLALWQATLAREQARKASAVERFLIDIFAANSNRQSDPMAARQTTARELLDQGSATIDTELADVPEARLGVLQLFGELYKDLALTDDEIRMRELSVEQASALYGATSVEHADALVMLAGALESGADMARRDATLDQAAAILDRRGDRRSATRGRLLRRLAHRYENDDLPRALQLVQEAVRVFDALPESIDLADSLAREGSIELGLRLTAEAVASYQRAIAVSSRVSGDPNPDLVRYYSYLGEAQWRMLAIEDGERSNRKAVEISMAINGPDHIHRSQVESRLGKLLFNTGRLAEGLEFIASAKSVALKVNGPDDARHLPGILLIHGHALTRIGRVLDGLADIQAAIVIERRVRPGGAFLATMLETAAISLRLLDRDDAALAALDEASAIREPIGQADASTRNNINVRERIRLALDAGKVGAARALLDGFFVEPGEQLSFSRLEYLSLDARIALAESDAGRALDAARRIRAAIDDNGLSIYLVEEQWQADLLEGRALLQAGRPVEAREPLRRAAMRAASLFDAASPLLAESRQALADCDEAIAAAADAHVRNR